MPVNMQLNDAEQRAILGLPSTKPKVHNPFFDATELDKAGKRKEAEHIYLELMNQDFENPVLLAALGMNYAVAEKTGLAFTLLTKALAGVDGIVPAFKRLGVIPKGENKAAMEAFISTKRSEILNAIGTCYKHENRTQEARECFEQAQAGLPINPDIQNNLGTLYINEGDPQKALEHMNLALSIDPNHAQAHWNKSLALLEMGQYAEGWPEYDWGFAGNVRMERNYTKEPIPVWDGTPGQTIVVYGEQGIGDEILFASCLNELIGCSKQVVFECHKRLHTIFANSFPTIDIYPTREDETLSWPINPDGAPRYKFDAKIAIGSLPRYFRPNLESFPGVPYVQPGPKAELTWNERLAALGPKPKIGIAWIGGHKRTRVEVRSMFLEQLLPILKQDATFISLQYTPCEDEIAKFEKEHGIKIHHFPEAVYAHNYDETAGLVANLDLVITVCTSVVHLAGSMGVPTWVLTPSRPAWRYKLEGDEMPWYSSVNLFRQKEGSVDWIPVVQDVAENLSDLLSSILPKDIV